MTKPICKSCYFKCRFEKEDWCEIIENEHGGSIKANRTECHCYLKKGTEPKWLCCKCGKNTFGKAAYRESGKWWCNNCHYKEEARRWAREKAIKYKENLKKLSDILGGDKKKAEKIMELLKEK